MCVCFAPSSVNISTCEFLCAAMLLMLLLCALFGFVYHYGTHWISGDSSVIVCICRLNAFVVGSPIENANVMHSFMKPKNHFQ